MIPPRDLTSCITYTRRRCRCTHTARQHRDAMGHCFAAPNACSCPKFVQVDAITWCERHHRPATQCEADRKRRADAAATNIGVTVRVEGST